MPTDYTALEIVAAGDCVQFPVKVVPGASREQVAGLRGTSLKITVSAPPEGGKANAAVAKLLASVLGVKRTDVRIVSGHSQPLKRIAVAGLTPADVRQRLSES